MRFAALASVGLAIGLMAAPSPIRVAKFLLVALTFLPSTINVVVTGTAFASGGTFDLIPVTVLTFAVVAGVALRVPHEIVRIKLPLLTAIFVPATLAAAAVCTLTSQHSGGKVQLLDSLLGPFLFGMVFLWVIQQAPDNTAAIQRFVLALGAIEAILGIVQYCLQRPLIFESQYQQTTWYKYILLDGFRAMGTFDHPLNFGLFLLVCVVLVSKLSSTRAQGALQTVFLLGILASGARTPLVLATLYVVVGVLANSGARARVASLFGVLALGVAWLGPLGSVVSSRFSDDGGSANVRREAFRVFSQMNVDWLSGAGLSSSYFAGESAGLRTSLESPVLMLALDIGIVWMLLLLVGIALVGAREWGSRPKTILEACGPQVVLVASLTYSSFGLRSSAGYIVWLGVVLCVSAPRSGGSPTPKPPIQAPPLARGSFGKNGERAPLMVSRVATT